MRSKIIVPLSVAMVLCGCSQAPVEQPVHAYEVLEIAPSDIDLQAAYPAAISGRQDIDIFPKVSGFIEKVCIREGESVRRGQPLFVIEQVQFRAALQTARANVEAAKAGVATAQLTYDSKKELFARNVISQFDLSLAENQLLTAKAQLAQAEAQEIDARNNLSYTTVTSPVDGVAGTLPYRAGTLVGPSMPRPLTTVSDNSSMYVYFSMTESQLLDLLRQYGSTERALAEMPDVSLQLGDGTRYAEAGRIETVSGVIDPTTGAVSLRAVFPNNGGLLRSGGAGNVIIPSSRSGVLVIPQNVTFEVQDQIFVYRIVDGKASQTRIGVAGANDGKHYIVESGIAAGDTILGQGIGMVRDGEQLTVQNQ